MGELSELFFVKVVFQPFIQQHIVLIGRSKCYLIKHFHSQECLHILRAQCSVFTATREQNLSFVYCVFVHVLQCALFFPKAKLF